MILLYSYIRINWIQIVSLFLTLLHASYCPTTFAAMAHKRTNKIRLVNLIQKKYPGLSYKQAFLILKEIKMRNKGTLIGMKFRMFKRLLTKIQRERWSEAKEREKTTLQKARALSKTCPICYKFFIRRKSRDMHIKIIHEKTFIPKKVDSATFACSQCDKKYCHEVSLKRHAKTHNNAQQKFSCDDCDKTFTRKDNLWRHRERIHKLLHMNVDAVMDKKDNKCNMCHLKFNDKEMLITHLSLNACFVGLTDEEKFKCTSCNKSYYYKSDLRRHVKTKHGRNIKLGK